MTDIKTRAKFVCKYITQKFLNKDSIIESVILEPVMENSFENESFFKQRPSGQIELSLLHSGAFILGKSYYIDFTLADIEIPTT